MKVNVLLFTVFMLLTSIVFSQENNTRKTDSLLTVFSNPKTNFNKDLSLRDKQMLHNGVSKSRFGNMPCYKANMNELEKMPVAKADESITYKMPVLEEKYIDKLSFTTDKFKIVNGKIEKIKEE